MKKNKKNRLRLLVTISFILSVLVGCVPDRPMVRIEKGINISDYRAIEVEEAINSTGIDLPKIITEQITNKLKSKLEKKGLILNHNKDSKKNILILRSSLITYDSTAPIARALVLGSKDECIVYVELVDKEKNKIIGDFVAKGTTMGGGILASVRDPQSMIIDTATESIAEEIVSR